MSAPEMVTVVVDGREIQVPKGTGVVETALAAGIEIPVFCYEPRLGPPVGACRMCLVEVEGMPKLQAGCTLTATDGMIVKTAQTSQLAADGQNSTLEFILVNHPLDCPVCDKGGECPLPGPHVPLGPAGHAQHLPEAHLREADPDLADDRPRPRALHPLLPLHALLVRRGRGRPADHARPRIAVGDRDLRGRAVQRALLRQRDRALPRRSAHVDAVPLRGAPLGDPGRADRLRHVPRRLQRRRDHARGQGQAGRLAQPPGGGRGLALRQGPIRVLPPARRGPRRPIRVARSASAATRRSPGTRRSTRPRR